MNITDEYRKSITTTCSTWKAKHNLDAFPIPSSTLDALLGVVELGMGDGSPIFTKFNFHFH